MKSYDDYGIELANKFGAGESYTTCPKCSKERRKKHVKCLSVNLDKQVWCCHHCGWSGSLKTGEDHRRVADHWLRPQYIRPAPPVDLPRDKMVDWFAGRGIPLEVIERNGISMTSVYMPQLEEHTNAIAFPFRRGDELINHKYRDGHKNFRMDAGAERILYGYNDINDDLTIIVEGEMDKLAVEVAGMRNCVSVPDGAPEPTAKNYAAKFEFLNDDRLSRVKQWVLAVDNDEAGVTLEDELARRLGRENCRRVVWPANCKDANDVLKTHGAEVLRSCIDNAQPYPIAGVFEISDLADRIHRLYAHGWEEGVETGWSGLKELYTVRPGEFTVITGIPNSGKSNWLDCLIVNLAMWQGWRFAIFSPENQPLEDHMARMLEKGWRKPFGPGPTERMSASELAEAMDWAQQHFHWILPDDDTSWNLDTVLDAARQLVKRYGIRGLVIDPWNEMEHLRPPGMSETEYISHALKRMRQFARHNGVHLWVIAHPAKLYRDKKTGSYPLPTLYDISGSAHWRNKCDNGICIWRVMDNPDAPVEIHVQKVRFRQIGRLGMAQLFYSKVTQTYEDVGIRGAVVSTNQ